MYLFQLKYNVFSLITNSLICLLKVILQLTNNCKAWQFTPERLKLLFLIHRKNITKVRSTENLHRIPY